MEKEKKRARIDRTSHSQQANSLQETINNIRTIKKYIQQIKTNHFSAGIPAPYVNTFTIPI
jgi:hypothetical protein